MACVPKKPMKVKTDEYTPRKKSCQLNQEVFLSELSLAAVW